MQGVHYIVNERGEKTAVVIDLKKNASLLEDLRDIETARSRAKEPHSGLAEVRARLERAGKLRKRA